MPQNISHRTWCKNCQDFTIHQQYEELTCSCGTKFTGYSLLEVPAEKLEIQRKRYADRKRAGLMSIYASAVSMKSMSNDRPIFIEDDAGMQSIIDQRNAIRKQNEERLQNIRNEYQLYSKLGRNDKCLCESGKKFKQCHLLFFRQFLNV